MLANNPTKDFLIFERDFSNILKFEEKKSIYDLKVKNKRVLVRVDFNVPINELGEITDSRRIERSLPTIKYLQEMNCRIILISHLGRPNGEVIEKLKLTPIFTKLQEFLPLTNIYKADDCIGPDVEDAVSRLDKGEILLLENSRFHKEEKENDSGFSEELSRLADVYITDAFATAHRRHSSTYGVCDYLTENGYGFLMKKELEYLTQSIEKPKRPFTVILGGAKVKDKLDVIGYLLGLADNILIGGGMAYTFLLAKGYSIGQSIKDESKLDEVKEYFITDSKGTKIFLPEDVIVCDDINSPNRVEAVSIENIKEKDIGADIGKKTITKFQEILKNSKQVLWNGPMGIFEKEEFERGTKDIAEFLVENKIHTIVGGGDSAAAFEKYHLQDKVSFISTGGGASLEIMKGSLLPGIECLKDKK
ncbi:MAG: phosphoglycerate kinase [Candidatus Heimdallarchaeota archaeon]|nr:phosphoglycerate kinase [Candidatus Heimdallarchaeota archaeon]